ncbi:MAG: hypothetical protein D6E12_04500 [Desulfovibrio sp.]|nr:MAG: hypothetical protein D6E12_04500 [Desulfovibrio sp.]
MLKWIAKQVGVGSTAQQMAEIKEFIEQLRTIGIMEMGTIADLVVEFRILFEKKTIHVSDPVNYITKKPAILTRLEDFVNDLAKGDDYLKATAVKVWFFTLIAAHAIGNGKEVYDFRRLGKDMWKEVARGFSEESGAEGYPKGFAPDE